MRDVPLTAYHILKDIWGKYEKKGAFDMPFRWTQEEPESWISFSGRTIPIGGVVKSTKTALVGEYGGETIIPLPSGKHLIGVQDDAEYHKARDLEDSPYKILPMAWKGSEKDDDDE